MVLFIKTDLRSDLDLSNVTVDDFTFFRMTN
jgi:hypothetical protein